jgi:hypothetical protein
MARRRAPNALSGSEDRAVVDHVLRRDPPSAGLSRLSRKTRGWRSSLPIEHKGRHLIVGVPKGRHWHHQDLSAIITL